MRISGNISLWFLVEVPRNCEVAANVIWDVHLLSHLRIQLIDEVSLRLHLLLNSCISGNQKEQSLLNAL